jgi:effector-binding domain-containing protein
VTYEVRVREVEVQPVLSIRAVVPVMALVGFFDEACKEMYEYLEREGVRPAGPPLSLWHSDPESTPGESDIEVCVPVERPVLPSGRMKAGELPDDRLAYTIHEGPYDNMGGAFDAVWGWIRKNSREPAGPPRDVVLVGPNDTNDPTQYRTEIAWPLR